VYGELVVKMRKCGWKGLVWPSSDVALTLDLLSTRLLPIRAVKPANLLSTSIAKASSILFLNRTPPSWTLNLLCVVLSFYRNQQIVVRYTYKSNLPAYSFRRIVVDLARPALGNSAKRFEVLPQRKYSLMRHRVLP
jgi:hypothetical protein